jgi:hypothetical protein
VSYHIADQYFFLYIYHKSLIQSKVMFFFKSGPEDQIKKCSKYCVIKCVKTKHVLKGNFASSIFHSCNAETQICVTGPQCVNIFTAKVDHIRFNNSCLRLPASTSVNLIFQSRPFSLGGKLVQQLQYIQLTLSISLL